MTKRTTATTTTLTTPRTTRRQIINHHMETFKKAVTRKDLIAEVKKWNDSLPIISKYSRLSKELLIMIFEDLQEEGHNFTVLQRMLLEWYGKNKDALDKRYPINNIS